MKEFGQTLKKNVRGYMMYIALVIIMIFFNFNTHGGFLSARNLSNLINQAGYVAVLAIGMTIILIIVQIDLSVGYVAGFCGAVAAILMSKHNVPGILTVFIVMLVGLAIGTYQGLIVTRIGVPAFVTTLAGMFIFRGLLSLSLQETGSIITSDKFFNALSNGYVPDVKLEELFGKGVLPANLAPLHLVTIIIGVIGILLVYLSLFSARKNRKKYNFKVMKLPFFILELVLIAVVVMAIVIRLSSFNGIPWTAVIVGVILIIYNFMLNKTKLGRAIYGVGGNAQAAELSGINVKKVMMFAFMSMGFLASIAGILFTARLKSATPTAGTAFEMDAIASSYIGGVAVSGGIGKVTNTIIGALVIMSLTNGMNLMGVDISYQYVVKGIIFIIAVAFDVRSRKSA